MEPSDAPAPAVGPGGLMDSARLPPVPRRRPRRRACHATMIRVRLPNHLYVEGLFKAEETPADLHRWLDTLLLPDAPTAAATATAAAEPAESAAATGAAAATAASSASKHPDYYLYISPPRQQLSRHSRLTFAQLGLLPAALVHFGRGVQAQQAQGAGQFAVEPDTPEQIAAREANPAHGLLRDEWAARVRKILPPLVTARAPTAATPEEKKSAAPSGEELGSNDSSMPAVRPAETAATDSDSPAPPSANAMD